MDPTLLHSNRPGYMSKWRATRLTRHGNVKTTVKARIARCHAVMDGDGVQGAGAGAVAGAGGKRPRDGEAEEDDDARAVRRAKRAAANG